MKYFDVEFNATKNETEKLPPVVFANSYCLGALAIIVSVQSAALWFATTRLSQTPDEYAHLASGLELIHRAGFDSYNVNPPLIKSLVAVPAYFSGSRAPYFYSNQPNVRAEFTVGDLYERRDPIAAWNSLVRARRCLIIFHDLGTIALFLLASMATNQLGGVIAATLWAFSPMMLGLGPLLSFDIPAASIAIPLACLVWHQSTKPTGLGIFAVGIWTGIGWLTKFTLIPVGFVLLMWLGCFRIASSSAAPMHGGRKVGRAIRSFGPSFLALIIGFTIMLSGYHFQSCCAPWVGKDFRSDRFQSISSVLNTALERLDVSYAPSLLPKDLLKGLDTQSLDLQRPIPTLYLGRWQMGGDIRNWLIGLFVKMPLELVLLSLVGGFIMWRRRDLKALTFALGTIICFVSVASNHTGMTHNIRYLYPIVPFICFMAAFVSTLTHWIPRTMVSIAIFAYVLEAFFIWPFGMTYFNQSAGGAAGGRYLLQESNIDWGQGWIEVRRWMDLNQIETAIAVFDESVSAESLKVHRLEATPHVRQSSSRNTEVLIPVSLLQTWDREHLYSSWFKSPKAQIGNSILVFSVTEEQFVQLASLKYVYDISVAKQSLY